MTSNSEPSPFLRLSLNSATTKKLTLAEVVDGCVRAGIPAIAPWRDRVKEAGLDKAAKLIKDAGLRVSSLCRGGFLTAPDAEGQAAALADNRAAVLEAAALDTRELFLVVGGLAPGEKDVLAARQRVADRLADLVPFASENGIRLVLEPLHPMYAADRAVISTLGQALDLAAPFDTKDVGVAVDTFHVWWDPELKAQIERAGREDRIASYQVCDFNMPIAADPLLSRGYMGDGVIDFATIGTWVRDAGYTGDIEVEIFNQEIWDLDGNIVLSKVKERYAELVLPYA
ncbi:sugar phosphate isomerase/epimerase family protein [Pseudarthrobacter cellobiosi]|uniref:sugar phosphate isomerase/epimerase family protein n=1 Tax=Pseudarthrobacter cellobiosi TaxID=2953654 RepID=UPI00208DEF10|nr:MULTISPECIES: sugar phosphate isomerase/epimerase family protein [unclassified Pseudarthrobacter]MCO4257101.1 sugar phosphate isomerase/epimerase [Pseudarthrobacter sp. HLT1-5]MCO4274207.1 sugar phosphate isomerase/epimerase [Pseudarthrobacter sp. HLT3-5]